MVPGQTPVVPVHAKTVYRAAVVWMARLSVRMIVPAMVHGIHAAAVHGTVLHVRHRVRMVRRAAIVLMVPRAVPIMVQVLVPRRFVTVVRGRRQPVPDHVPVIHAVPV